jgi:hypothetical protein
MRAYKMKENQPCPSDRPLKTFIYLHFKHVQNGILKIKYTAGTDVSSAAYQHCGQEEMGPASHE